MLHITYDLSISLFNESLLLYEWVAHRSEFGAYETALNTPTRLISKVVHPTLVSPKAEEHVIPNADIDSSS